MKDNQVELIDEAGKKITLSVIASLKIEKRSYAILHDDAKDEDYIFKIIGDGEYAQYEMVDDADEQQEVLDAYYEL